MVDLKDIKNVVEVETTDAFHEYIDKGWVLLSARSWEKISSNGGKDSGTVYVMGSVTPRQSISTPKLNIKLTSSD